jgi:predicted ester cyclase
MPYRGPIYAISLLIALLPAGPSKAEPDKPSPSATVNAFLHDVWGQGNPDAIDRYVAEDFVITTGGKEIRSRDAFKKWVVNFQSKISDMNFEVLETIQNADGSRVVTRMRLRGKNNGMFGLEPDQKPFVLTATAIWSVGPDGQLVHNWVERNAWEVYIQLVEK